MKNEKSVKETLEKVQNDLSLEQGEDLFASLLSDQKVMQNFLSLGFSTEDVKDYLIPLSEYQASLHACAHCKNVNACQNSIPHFTYQLAVEDDGSLGLRMGRCEKILEKELAASRFLLRDFPVESFDLLGVHLRDVLVKPGSRRVDSLQNPHFRHPGY